MSPRRNRPRERRADEPGGRLPPPESFVSAPPGWQVRAIQPASALKEYRCPGCDHEIRPGTAHVVAWRNGEEEHRRHWHRPCWDRERRTIDR